MPEWGAPSEHPSALVVEVELPCSQTALQVPGASAEPSPAPAQVLDGDDHGEPQSYLIDAIDTALDLLIDGESGIWAWTFGQTPGSWSGLRRVEPGSDTVVAPDTSRRDDGPGTPLQQPQPRPRLDVAAIGDWRQEDWVDAAAAG